MLTDECLEPNFDSNTVPRTGVQRKGAVGGQAGYMYKTDELAASDLLPEGLGLGYKVPASYTRNVVQPGIHVEWYTVDGWYGCLDVQEKHFLCVCVL